MNIIYISPNNYVNPHLFPTFQKTFGLNGHNATDYPQEATHCFIELISGNYIQYSLKLRDVFDRKIPIVIFDNREYGTMNNEEWNYGNLRGDIYFVRNYNKRDYFPKTALPFDWSYFPECDFEPVTKDELFSRSFDAALLAVESPTRRNVINGLYHGRIKLCMELIDCTRRYPYNRWINLHKMAKFFISADGGGFTNERPQQLFAIAPMIQNRSNHIMANPFTDMVNCLEIDEHPTKEDIDKILSVANNKEKLYEIYTNGIHHVKTKMSEEANSLYVLRKIKEVLGEC